ncbi:MAG: hypothetical protein GDA56_08530 [Hormoscilla sp. GM7CHS1pb]|nr:hypothetical protein [Hormoscilla sp. GM7CHS1pb]
MPIEIVPMSSSGTFVLLEELQNSLMDKPEIAVFWNKEVIVLKPIEKHEPVEPRSKEEKIRRFFEIADRQVIVKDIIGISESEIQAEIEAYRAEKRCDFQHFLGRSSPPDT